MIYLKLFEGFKDIDAICKKYLRKNYYGNLGPCTINRDGTIDVNGNVDLSPMNPWSVGFERLPLKFNYVSGNFYCNNNKLKTLEGVPKEVGGYFNCCHNKLTSLEGAPKVGGDFYCGYNKLVSLEGAPRDLGGFFDCRYNQLTTLEGSPREVGGYFNCGHNKLTSLKGAPKEVGSFNCDKNPLPQLIIDNYEYIDEIIKWQDEYNIWRNGKLDKFRFEEMMIDIKNEVGS